MARQHPLITPIPQQLSLPLLEQELVPFCVQPEPPPLPPEDVWTSLSLMTRAQVRHTLLRIIQEVLHDDTCSGQDYRPSP
jgi:hypothetical protein